MKKGEVFEVSWLKARAAHGVHAQKFNKSPDKVTYIRVYTFIFYSMVEHRVQHKKAEQIISCSALKRSSQYLA